MPRGGGPGAVEGPLAGGVELRRRLEEQGAGAVGRDEPGASVSRWAPLLARPDELARLLGEVLLVEDIQVGGAVSRVLGALELRPVLLEDPRLHELPAPCVDGVRDVGVELHAAPVLTGAVLAILGVPLEEARAAVIAVGGAIVVLALAPRAALGQLPARHGDERTAGPLDDLQVADHELVIDRDAAERAELVVEVRHQLDSYLGYLHRPWLLLTRLLDRPRAVEACPPAPAGIEPPRDASTRPSSVPQCPG
jgi:hypothetical protein